VRARRGTAGVKPYTMKVVRTVFNGGHEETYGNATRLVPTQRECEIERLTALAGPPGARLDQARQSERHWFRFV
jgi:hypothetical protein